MSDDSHFRPWFRPKTFGPGMTPATWQGWVAVLVFIALLIGTTLLADPATIKPRDTETFIHTKAALGLSAVRLSRLALFGLLAAEIAAFVLFCRRMGAPVRPLD
ncbi:hypothetical protein [Phenylobacterium sp.]|uniref:hypothetical protein n=1 Tax=Phenylobacterium sp. TaxID=1871053 RepID=UPI00121F56B4|nr:hypothetical protein [Phenylobacterium sp.]THD51749.1 MAG: hypothetical protein E8A12_20590 [Phenylobacterium sp.]